MGKKFYVGLIAVAVSLTAVSFYLGDLNVYVGTAGTSFKIFNETTNRYVSSAMEYSKIYNGTKAMSATSRSVAQADDPMNFTNATRTSIFNAGISLRDNYVFDGNQKADENFPVAETHAADNAQGMIYQYEVSFSLPVLDMDLEGKSEFVFGRMKVKWEGNPFHAKVKKTSSGGKLILKFRILSNHEVFNIRLFDPTPPGSCNTQALSGDRNYLGFAFNSTDALNPTSYWVYEGSAVIGTRGPTGQVGANYCSLPAGIIPTDVIVNASNRNPTDFWIYDRQNKTIFHLSSTCAMSPDPTGNITLGPEWGGNTGGITTNATNQPLEWIAAWNDGSPRKVLFYDAKTRTNTENRSIDHMAPQQSKISTNATNGPMDYFFLGTTNPSNTVIIFNSTGDNFTSAQWPMGAANFMFDTLKGRPLSIIIGRRTGLNWNVIQSVLTNVTPRVSFNSVNVTSVSQGAHVNLGYTVRSTCMDTNTYAVENATGSATIVGTMASTATNFADSNGNITFIEGSYAGNFTLAYNITANSSAAVNVSDAKSVSYIGDYTPPKFSLNRTNFTSPLNYSTGGYQFNTSWTDEIALDKIFMEHNFSGSLANATVSTSQGGEYYYNFGPIGTGVYVWRSLANDTSNNWNSTINHYFQIFNSSNPINLWLSNATNQYLNRNVSITYPGITNSTLMAAYAQSGTFNLYRDDVLANAANNTNMTLSFGAKKMTGNVSGNQNYSGNSTTWWFNIAQGSSSAELLLNNSLANRTYFSDQVVHFTGNCSNAEQQVGLYFNASGFGDNFTSEKGTVYNATNASFYHSESNYNATAVCFDNGNYSQSSDSSFLEVDPGIDFYLNSTMNWVFNLTTQYNVQPQGQNATKPAVCLNNTRPGTSKNISVYTIVNITTLYNLTLFGSATYDAATSQRIGMRNNESWMFNSVPANAPKCLFLWANVSAGKKGTWTPDLYADARLA